MKVLVVDDEPTTRMLLHAVLSACGEVDCCEDGQEAVEAHRKALDDSVPYDVICMDLMMPKLGGLDAVRLIRREEEARGTPRSEAAKVIVTTAADDQETIRQAFRGSSDAYIVKPIDAAELIDIVRCLLPASDTRA